MNVINKDIIDIQKENMLTYSMSIICGRAIPDVKDGLKVVQRRILWGMLKGGYHHNKPHRKSAKIVGDVMGSYHPHGDSSIYLAAMRMSQPFNNNIVLIDPHGNNGNISGDAPAASRYTEMRLTKFAQDYLLDGINKNAVNMNPNYDHTEVEPAVLPSKLPLLLINGSSGIAAGGYATEIPAHNIVDVCNTVIELIDNPDLSVKKIAEKLRPDFPTGGILCSHKDITDAYITGRGNVKYRVTIKHESKKGKDYLVITDIQNGQTIGSLIDNIVQNSRASKDNPEPKITEIHDIRDESARGNIRIVIELKKGVDPYVVENKLYKHTSCEIVQKIILIATNGNSFKQYNIKELFTEWIAFRRETITRIFTFDIKEFKNRIHIIDGLLIALEDIDNVVEIIKKSKDTNEAKIKLIKKYQLSEAQASAILNMRLSRLTSMEINTLISEKEELDKKVEHLMSYLRDPSKIDELIKEEQREIIERYGSPRKTICNDIETDISYEDVIEDAQYLISISKDNYIKRMDHSFRSQRRGGKGSSSGKVRDGDFIESLFYANSKDHLLIFTNTGKVYDTKVWQIEESSLQSVGKSIRSYLPLKSNEDIKSVLCISNEEFENPNGYLVFATKNGLVKKTSMSEFNNIRESGIIAIRIREDDELLGVKYVESSKKQDIFLATKNGLGIRFSNEDIAITGRTTYGVKGITLKEDDNVSSFDVIEDEENQKILTVTSNGLAKRINIKNEFPVQIRGGKGRIAVGLNNDNVLVKALICEDDQDVIVISKSNTLRTNVDTINVQLRPSSGRRIIDLKENDEVIDVFLIKQEV